MELSELNRLYTLKANDFLQSFHENRPRAELREKEAAMKEVYLVLLRRYKALEQSEEVLA